MEMNILYKGKWLSLYEIDGYVCSNETRCNGRIVAVLPYRKVTVDGNTTIHFLLRKEVTPPWCAVSDRKEMVNSITGGIESHDPMDDAIREVKEEAGYDIPKEKMIYLGESFGAKSSDTVYKYFTCDVTGLTNTEPKGDGSKLESVEKCEWFSKIDKADDVLVYALWYKTFIYLQSIQQDKS
jgi:8-oxo-dGTP pyrophosphatase MutT (NUDIX family)